MNQKVLLLFLAISVSLNVYLGFSSAHSDKHHSYKEKHAKRSVRKKHGRQGQVVQVESARKGRLPAEKKKSREADKEEELAKAEKLKDENMMAGREAILEWEEIRDEFFLRDLGLDQEVLDVYLSLKDESGKNMQDIWEESGARDGGMPSQQVMLKVDQIRMQYMKQVENLLGKEKFEALLRRLDRFNRENDEKHDGNTVFITL